METVKGLLPEWSNLNHNMLFELKSIKKRIDDELTEMCRRYRLAEKTLTLEGEEQRYNNDFYNLTDNLLARGKKEIAGLISHCEAVNVSIGVMEEMLKSHY